MPHSTSASARTGSFPLSGARSGFSEGLTERRLGVAEPAKFDPYALLQALDQQRVTYIVIGGFARVLQGTEEITRSLDIVPSTRPGNLRRLDAALRGLDATRPDGRGLAINEDTIT